MASLTKVFSVPILLLALSSAALLLFLFLSSLSNHCSCPTTINVPNQIPSRTSTAQISSTPEDLAWLKSQLQHNHLRDPPTTPDAWHSLRKGINPRTRAQQLDDLRSFKGISHYENESESGNHTALPCPGELLVEEHHSNYGEPWAGGRDVFEFLAGSARLSPESRVLEIGCGTLRVGLHFIRYLDSGRFHCLERDELSLMAAFRYELPSQGLLHKRPLIVRGEDMEFERFGSNVVYDLIYASAVFLHMPDKLVWMGLERLATRLKPYDGRIFVSHNIKFCSRLGGEECTKRLSDLGLEYIGKHTHDSLLFNHYEIWFEFRRSKA
ncbi:S-adenosyl-L-methionine-dependent methyltransferases superfamily protein [Tasmannia lanceolata]|uniref:S-adenosyl-L-methionine-dependent methyltransferases superfamily protein n=1 Tax=Tasmannia lanceolata TaxID=3420 RepID=UPI0040632CE4